MPYQPKGIWEELAFGDGFSGQAYEQSHGRDLYRRGMYTLWKRTAPPASPNGDTTAARIVALDMALSGKPREETDRYLAEHYDVPDRGALLDEVYAAAGA